MRLIHLVFAIFFAAMIMGIARDEVGRVGLIVFATGLVEVVLATMALMALFQSIGAIGEADRPMAYLVAIGETAMVLLAATAAMNVVLWAGLWTLKVVVGPF